MKKLVLGVILLGILGTSGCIAGAGYLVRRAVVHDDWVLFQGVLYRRYIPDGVRLGGNPRLKEKGLKITAHNRKIKVFSGYDQAKSSGEKFIVDEGSLEYVPRYK